MTLASHNIPSPIGELFAIANDENLLFLDFRDSKELDYKKQKIEKVYGKIENSQNQILEKTEQELAEYFDGKRNIFTISCELSGTDFQRKSWQGLLQIPYGETRNYLEQAIQIGHPKAVRAIGGANHNNPISIIIPCHRVIGKSGKLVGYGGGIERKKWLLDHEKNTTHISV